MSDGADLDQVAGFAVGGGEGEAMDPVPVPAVLDGPAQGGRDDGGEGGVDGAYEIGGDVPIAFAIENGRQTKISSGCRVK